MRGRIVFLAAVSIICGAPQQPKESARQLWDSRYLDKATGATKQLNTVRYRSSNGPVAMTQDNAGTMIGITLWRLQTPSTSGGSSARLLVLDSDPNQPAQELEPERIDPDTLLSEGDHVRLSIE